MPRLSLRTSTVLWCFLWCSGCYGAASVLDRDDAGLDASGSPDTDSHDAGSDAGPATACMLLCEACGLWPCESHCARDCADEATASATCEGFLQCIMGPGGTDAGTDVDAGTAVPQPPVGVEMCGGRICAADEECCLLTGACVRAGDPSCVPEPGLTFPGSCTRHSDCDADEICEVPYEFGHGWQTGVCAGAVGECFERRPESDCAGLSGGNEVCGCDGRTYLHVCEASRAGVRLATPHDSCGTAIHLLPPDRCSRLDDPCVEPPHTNQHCDLTIGWCVLEEPLFACGIDAQCPTGESCCPYSGRCYDPSRPAACAVAPHGLGIPCADDVDCHRVSGEYWGAGGSMFCDGPGPDGLACGTSGGCRYRPPTCPNLDEPVCGCDGITYQSVCHAQSAGIRTAHTGACS